MGVERPDVVGRIGALVDDRHCSIDPPLLAVIPKTLRARGMTSEFTAACCAIDNEGTRSAASAKVFWNAVAAMPSEQMTASFEQAFRIGLVMCLLLFAYFFDGMRPH
jgi:hypothetical protein